MLVMMTWEVGLPGAFMLVIYACLPSFLALDIVTLGGPDGIGVILGETVQCGWAIISLIPISWSKASRAGQDGLRAHAGRVWGPDAHTEALASALRSVPQCWWLGSSSHAVLLWTEGQRPQLEGLC